MTTRAPDSGDPQRSLARVVGASTLLVLGAAAGGVALAGVAAAIGAARRVVTPPRRRLYDTRIIWVAKDQGAVTLAASPDAVVDGRYGFWFAHEQGNARLGDIVGRTESTVTRRIERVSFGDLSRARAGRFSGWYYLRPEELGLESRSVELVTENGQAPAWLVPGGDGSRWVIQVHGWSARRQEGLRAVPVFHEAGYTSLLVSYRNDGDAPASPDRRYALGTTEWRDVDRAIDYAVEHGAEKIVLMGWSMGGAIVLQAATRSRRRDAITGIVLESPVIDWVHTLRYQAGLLRLPEPVTNAALGLLGGEWGHRLTGMAAAIDLADLDFVAHADELTAPTLLMHSDDDGFVPSRGSRALAEARSDIVTFVPFHTARHTKLWNYDPDRWNGAIRDWLARLP